MTPLQRLERLRETVASYRANTYKLSNSMNFAARTAGALLDAILEEELAIKINSQKQELESP